MDTETRNSERGTRDARSESQPPRSAQIRVPSSEFIVGEPVALRARYVFPVAGKPLHNAVITLAGERIVAVGENASGRPPLDLGNVAILPGLVNAHTHLEFSNLAAPLGSPGEPLPDWIRKVIAIRRETAGNQPANIRTGLAEAIRWGTSTLGEIATGPWPQTADLPIDATVFYELIGFLPQQIDERASAARAHLSQPWSARPGLRPGLSPHAPYSVHLQLVDRLAAIAAEQQIPLAMHLAESREEIELLAAGTGPLRELLADLQVWSPQSIPLGTRVLDYLRRLVAAPRGLAIHCNYLAADEMDFLAAHSDRLAVVFCPRTHAYFGHSPYPLTQMLAAEVRVAIGTDSRASNPDLSLLEELRFVSRHYPQIAPQTVLELGTLSGARALGVSAEVGALVAGKLANLAIIPLPERDANDPFELLFDSAQPASQCWYRGRPIDCD